MHIHSTRRSRRGVRTLMALAVTAAGLAAVPAPATADTFLPENNGPVVDSLDVSPAISPDAGASSSVYEVTATVTDADTLADLAEVGVCLHHTAAGDPGCATPDPTDTVALSWTPDGDFTLDAGSALGYWALGTGGNQSQYPTLSGTSGTFTFRFTVSEAMRAGDWTAALAVTDSETTTQASAATAVAHYGTVTTRTDQDFGLVAPGAGGAARTTSPTVTANGAIAYRLQVDGAIQIDGGAHTFSLLDTGTTAPGAGQVAFDCNLGSVLDATPTRVGAAASELGTATATGTPEGGEALAHTCRLSHGGGRPVGEYAMTVVNTVTDVA